MLCGARRETVKQLTGKGNTMYQNPSNSDEMILEHMIDKYSLAAVLDAIASIADQKSGHIAESYGDKELSQAWWAAQCKIGKASNYAASNDL